MQPQAPQTPPQQQDLSKMQQPPQQIFAGASNSSGNVRPNQQGNMYRNSSGGSQPRSGPRHSMPQLQSQMFQPVVMQFNQSFTPRQPASALFAQGPFQFPQHMPANFSYQQYYYNSPMIQPATAATHQRGPATLAPGSIAVPNGPCGGPGATQGQMPLATGGVLATQGGPQNTNTGVVTGQTIPQSGATGSNWRRKRTHAIDIIHPETHKNILDEIELSKTQGTSNPELEYQEQISSAVDVGSVMHQDTDVGKGPAPYATYDIQQQQQRNDLIVQQTTPIVSAMSDAPSVEIHSKQLQPPKRKNKSIPIVSPLEKENKVPVAVTVDESTDKSSSSIQTSTKVPCSSSAKTAEEIPNTKAIRSTEVDATPQPQITAATIDIKAAAEPQPQPQQQQPKKAISTASVGTTTTSAATVSAVAVQPHEPVATKPQPDSTTVKVSKAVPIVAPPSSSATPPPAVAAAGGKAAPALADTNTNQSKEPKVQDNSHKMQPQQQLNGSNNLDRVPSANALRQQQQDSLQNSLNSTSISNKFTKLSDTNENLIENTITATESTATATAANSSSSSVSNSSSQSNKTSSTNTTTKSITPQSQQTPDETDRVAAVTAVQAVSSRTQAASDSLNNNEKKLTATVASDNSLDNSSKSNNNNAATTTVPAAVEVVESAPAAPAAPAAATTATNGNSTTTATTTTTDALPEKKVEESPSSTAAAATVADEAVDSESTKATAAKTQYEPLIKYNEGQWSPDNPTGSKQYDRTQLMLLRQAPASRVKPEVNSKAASVLIQNQRLPQQNLLPLFMRNNKRGQSMGGAIGSMGGGGAGAAAGAGGPSAGQNAYMKQSSMSGVNQRNSSKGNKPGMIHMSLSLHEDVKLNETENAWRPAHMKHDESTPLEIREQIELKRKVRGILNKLTPEKFDLLVEQIIGLRIDTREKVNDVMILVFEKAIDEPNFSVSYARLCKRLADEVKVMDGSKTDTAAQAANKTQNTLTIFKNALLDKTEREFNDNVSSRQAKEQKLQPIVDKIAKCTNPAEKAELEEHLADEERKIRRRSGGTVRFIGELFKISMLTANIIRTCIENLLDANSEDKLECLCKLLTTVGKKYESSKDKNGRIYSLDDKIKKMQAIADRKDSTKITSRVRFMLQDVIDLRKSKWVSTRTETPKTMEQIQKEAKNEQMTNQYMYSMMSSGGGSGGGGGGKKDDRRYGSGGNNNSSSGGNMSFGGGASGNGYGRRQQQGGGGGGNDDWHVQTSKGNRAVDTHKLNQILNSDIDLGAQKLGSSSQFTWNQGAGSVRPTTTTSNSFAALSSLDTSRNNANNSSRNNSNKGGAYNRGSLERDRYDRDRGMHLRSGGSSAHGSRDNSSSRNQPSRFASGAGSNSNSYNMQKSASHQNSSASSSSLSRPSSKTSLMGPPDTLGAASVSQQSKTQYPTAAPPADFAELDSDKASKIIKAIREMVDIAFESSPDDIIPVLQQFPDNLRWSFIYIIFSEYLHGKVKEPHRRAASDIVDFMLTNKFIALEHFKYGYEKFSEEVGDLIIDVPEAWNYIFQFAGPLIAKKHISVHDLWTDELRKQSSPFMGKKFLKEFLIYCTREIGPDYTRKMWKRLNLKWSDFLLTDSPSDIENFIKTNKFEYIENDKCNPEIVIKEDKDRHTQRVMNRVKELLNQGANAEAIKDYLAGNIVDYDKQFIRGLTTTLCNYSLTFKNGNCKFEQARFQSVCPILTGYIDSDEGRELECLYAMQLLSNQLEHPAGLLSDFFCELYDNDVIPQESFIKWRDSKEELTGKGVAVMGLNPFFTNVLNGETSDENN